jgi:hypothetical protein
MTAGRRISYCWAVWWHSRHDSYLIGEPNGTTRTALFPTRRAARTYIAERYGYIKKRLDLQEEPHGWKVPTPVKVQVIVEMETRP